jgi:hypothetical protein
MPAASIPIVAMPLPLPVLIFLGVGVLLLVGAFVDVVRGRARRARWTRVEGVVVGYRTRHHRRDGRLRKMHHPIVEYAVGDRRLRHESSVSTSTPRHEIGAALPILFDPAQPDEAIIDAFGVKYFVALVLGGIGAGFVGVAGWLSTQPP